MATVYEIVQALSQAAANAYDGAHDADGEAIKAGLQREEGRPLIDRRVMDGFNVRFHGNDHAAWVFVEENLLGSSLSAVAAVNVFIRVEGNWKMVGHQAAPLIPDLDISSGS